MSNSKLDTYSKIAEHKYVEELKSTTEISKEIPVAERTIRGWRNKLGWEDKKHARIKHIKNIGAKLYRAADLILEKFLKYLENPEEQDPISDIEERILRDALSKLPTFSKFEQTKEDSEKKNTSTKSTDEKLNEVLERFL